MNPMMGAPAASDLMGATSPADQVAGETAEQRRKRLMSMKASQQTPVGATSLAAGYGSALTMA